MYKLFSQRIKEKETPEHSLKYDSFPPAFIQQFFFIAEDYFNHLPKGQDYWEELCRLYCLESGIPLIGRTSGKYMEAIQNYIEDPETDSIVILDIAELAFSKIPSYRQKTVFPNPTIGISMAMDQVHKKYAINSLNERFQQHSLGYRFMGELIVRIDSNFMAEEIIQPAEVFLCGDKRYSSAAEEYHKALRFRRDGDYPECISNANKAFESVLKIICEQMAYTEPQKAKKDSAGSYLGLLRTHHFYPSYCEDHFKALCNTLEKGLPVLRNKNGSHGAGSNVIETDAVLADYALHLAATNIAFLVDLFKQKKKP